MIRGSSKTKLDAKQRLLVGARLADGLGSKVIIVKGNGPYLNVFPTGEFKKLEKRIEALTDLDTEQGFKLFFDNKFQSFLANFYSNQVEAEVDEQARITIPGFLRDEVDLSGDLIVRSTGRYLQIWKQVTFYQRQGSDAELDTSAFIGNLSLV
jgi:MraZ protein